MRLGVALCFPVAVAALAVTGCTVDPARQAAPHELAAPAVEDATVLGTWTGLGGDVTATVDAEGAGLIVALDCVGGGSVQVSFSPGTTSRVSCPAGDVTSDRNRIPTPHPEPMTLTVSSSPGVAWGLTVAELEP